MYAPVAWAFAAPKIQVIPFPKITLVLKHTDPFLLSSLLRCSSRLCHLAAEIREALQQHKSSEDIKGETAWQVSHILATTAS